MTRTDTAASELPRKASHARVVPLCVLEGMRKPFQCWVGEIWPTELHHWDREADLTERARREIRSAVITRLRPKMAEVWSRPVGVRLEEGWETRFPPRDAALISSLGISSERPLQSMTLRQVKDTLALNLDRTLEILAVLESLYWRPQGGRSHPARQPEHPVTSVVELSDDIKVRAQQVLGMPWIDEVSPTDLRLHYHGSEVPSQQIKAALDAGKATGSLCGLIGRLHMAGQMTADQEAQDIVEHVSKRLLGHSGRDSAQARWSAVVQRRFISAEGDGRTLEAVGQWAGITRERVRQICEAFIEAVGEFDVACPAVDRVLQASARIAPATVEEVNDQLRRFIGPQAGVEALVAWHALLRPKPSPVQCVRVRKLLRGRKVEVTMVQRPGDAAWVEAMLKHASRDSYMHGCTNVLRVAGLLALKEEVAPGLESLQDALEATQGFRWLDKATGWFSIGDSSMSSLAARVRKLLAVARDTVGTDEIAAALASDDMWMYRENSSLGLATPPVHVLRELISAWPWLKRVQKGRFVASADLGPDGTLNAAEAAVVRVIEEHGGVACRFELKEAVVGDLGLTDMRLALLLGTSPFIERVEHGIYKVRARRMADGAFDAARRRSEARVRPLPAEMLDAGPDEFALSVTVASLRNEQYAVPARLAEQLKGKAIKAIGKDGAALGELRVNASGALRGVNRLFPSAQSGDYFRLKVTAEGLVVAHHARRDDDDGETGKHASSSQDEEGDSGLDGIGVDDAMDA